MIQTIVTLFAAFQLSSANRLLLQSQGAPWAAIPQQQPAAVPEPVEPANPVIPNAGGAPFVPAQPTPLHPVALEPVEPIEPTPLTPNIDIKCDVPFTLPATTPGRCAGHITTSGQIERKLMPFTVPMDGLKLNCGGMGSCAYSDIYLTIPPGLNVQFIEGFWFKEELSGFGSTVTIMNNQVNAAELANAFGAGGNGQLLEIGKITCEANQSCQNMEIVYDSRTCFINEFICENGCDGCMLIDVGQTDPLVGGPLKTLCVDIA